jgi:hypothetical protein
MITVTSAPSKFIEYITPSAITQQFNLLVEATLHPFCAMSFIIRQKPDVLLLIAFAAHA